MQKVAIVVLTNSDSPEGRGRMVHALHLANDLKEANDDIKLVFEGIGVTWLDAFAKRDHPFTENYGPLFDAVEDKILGACNFCSTRFDVRETVQSKGYNFLGDEGKHHRTRDLIAAGYQIINF